VDQRAEPPSWLPEGAQPKTGAGADVRSPDADKSAEAAPGGTSEYSGTTEYSGAAEYSFDGESSFSNGSDYSEPKPYPESTSYSDSTSYPDPASQVPPYPAQLSETPASQRDQSAAEPDGRTSTFSAIPRGRYLAGAAAVLPGKAKAAKSAKPAKASKPAAQVAGRRADLVVARLEPWSVMKFSFLMSLVAWVVLFVAVAFLYFTLSSLGVFTSLQHTLSSVTSSTNSSGMQLNHWFSASRILGYTMLLGAVNIILITALCTVGSMIYNLVTHLGGGIEVTLRETD
jgi:Transmembrane domain of unknown function (DUF3566)